MRGYVRVHGKYPQYFVLIHGMRAYLLSRNVFSRGVIDLRGIDLLGGVCWLLREPWVTVSNEDSSEELEAVVAKLLSTLSAGEVLLLSQAAKALLAPPLMGDPESGLL